jgi:hypothetical protein
MTGWSRVYATSPTFLPPDVSIAQFVRWRMPHRILRGFVLTRVAAETLVCTSRAYASLHAACLSGLVTLNLRSNSWRISRARSIPILQIDHQPPFIEPSANSDFIDPIQLPNLVFDLCDSHNDSSAPEPLKIARRTSLTPHFLDRSSLLLHRAQKMPLRI